MAELTPFLIGADVTCFDGPCGKISRVVLDPATMTVTHLVVQPTDRRQLGRLVPLALVPTAPARLRLRCTTAAFYQLAAAQKTEFVQGTGDYARYGQGHPPRPYLAQLRARPGAGVHGQLPRTFTYDVLPEGQVAVRYGNPVHAADGDLGNITGLVMEADSRRVAFVLVHVRHLLSGRDIAVPVDAVTRVDAGIELDVTRQAARHLPPLDLDR
jgi:hypothetical protein